MSADLYFTRVSSSFFLLSFFFFFAAYFPRSLNATEQKSATWSEVSVIWKRMSEIWDTPSPYKSGAQKPPFGRLRNLTATSAAYIFGMKDDIDNRSSALFKGSPTSSQNVMNFGPQTASNSTCIFTHSM